MSNLKKAIARKMETMIKFRDLAKAIRFVTGGEFARVRKKLHRRFVALSSFTPLFFSKYISSNGLDMDDHEEDVRERILLIPITDDRTSCGAHNRKVIKKVDAMYAALVNQNHYIKFYPIGLQVKKYCSLFHRRNIISYSVGMEELRFSLDMLFFFVKKILKFSFTEHLLVFNRYITMTEQFPMYYRISNFYDFVINIFMNIYSKYGIYYDSILDSSMTQDFLEDLYVFSFSLFFLDALWENKFSFLASRYNAMDTMMQNTQELYESLLIRYHKLRQELITTELIEVITGASCVE